MTEGSPDRDLLARLREGESMPESLVEGVMKRVSVAQRPRRATALRRGASYLLAAAAVLIVAVTGATMRRETGTATVRFQINVPSPGVRTVTLAGDFNGWNPSSVPLVHDARTGAWSVDVNLVGGRYAYAFVLDGERWIADPTAPLIPDDGFGRPSSIVVVSQRGAE